MNLPNKLTVGRLILSPVFFVFYFLPLWTGDMEYVSGILILVVFLGIEISDFLDGYIARKYNLVSDLGKVLDPFADVVSRLTYFLSFAFTGIMPLWIFLIIMYRELGIIFFRMVMIKKGVVVAASVWGKLKAVTYAFSGVLGVGLVFIRRTGMSDGLYNVLKPVSFFVFVAAAAASVASFWKYLSSAKNSNVLDF